MDRFKFLPMGFRRPWVLAAQGALIASLVAMAALGDLDVTSLGPLMAAGFVVNAFAATQDVAVDGMAIDILPEDERGRANAFMAFGQVAGASAFGALCATLLPMFGLPVTALVCAAAVAVIFVFCHGRGASRPNGRCRRREAFDGSSTICSASCSCR